MTRHLSITAMLALTLLVGCSRHQQAAPVLKATAAGSAIVVSSGDKQLGNPGTALPQPVVAQVNDDQGNGVTGALVHFDASAGVHFDPAAALTDASGQVTTNVTLGDTSGRYQLTAASVDKKGKPLSVQASALAAGYQQQLGYELQKNYCSRCHDPESTPEQVSNYDNLAVKPHSFDQGDTFNKLSDADLTAIVSHGGPALNLSALMPAYGSTLSEADIRAVIAYIRLVSDPPYQAPGLVYAKR